MSLQNDYFSPNNQSVCMPIELSYKYSMPKYVIFYTDKLFPTKHAPPEPHNPNINMLDDKNILLTGPDMLIETPNDIIVKNNSVGEIIIPSGIRILPADLFKYGPLIISIADYKNCTITYYSAPEYDRRLKLIQKFFTYIVYPDFTNSKGQTLLSSNGVLSFINDRIRNQLELREYRIAPYESNSQHIRVKITGERMTPIYDHQLLKDVIVKKYPLKKISTDASGLENFMFDVKILRENFEKLKAIFIKSSDFITMKAKFEVYDFDSRKNFDLNHQYITSIFEDYKKEIAEINKMFVEGLIEAPQTID